MRYKTKLDLKLQNVKFLSAIKTYCHKCYGRKLDCEDPTCELYPYRPYKRKEKVTSEIGPRIDSNN